MAGVNSSQRDEALKKISGSAVPLSDAWGDSVGLNLYSRAAAAIADAQKEVYDIIKRLYDSVQGDFVQECLEIDKLTIEFR